MKYPQMRDELVDHLCALSDRDYQEAAWVRHERLPGVAHDELDYAIHFIFDDTCLGSDPSGAIGWFLRDEKEADAIRVLVGCLAAIFAKYGTELTDGEYISLPEWSGVLASAALCRDELKRSR